MRWIAPTLAAETLPYCVLNWSALSADVLQHRAQILQVEQEQSVFVGDLEDHVEHAFLGVVQTRASARAAAAPSPKRSRAPGDRARRTHPRNTTGRGFAFEIVDPELLHALENFRIIPARLADPGEIAFHVGHENRHAARAEIFRQRLQRDGLAGAGRAGDQAVAIRHFRQQKDLFLRLCDKNRFGHDWEIVMSLPTA